MQQIQFNYLLTKGGGGSAIRFAHLTLLTLLRTEPNYLCKSRKMHVHFLTMGGGHVSFTWIAPKIQNLQGEFHRFQFQASIMDKINNLKIKNCFYFTVPAT